MQRIRQMAIIAIVIFYTSLIFSCKDKQDVKPGDIVARVGDGIITKQEFEQTLGKSLSRSKSLGRNNQPASETRIEQTVLEQMIDTMIIESQAKKLNIIVDEKEIVSELEEQKRSFGDEKVFERYMKMTQTTEQDLKKEIRYNILRRKVLDKMGGEVNVTDKEVIDFFEKNKESYVEPEKVKASHILFKLNINEFLNPDKIKTLEPDERKKEEAIAKEKAKRKAMEKAKKVLDQVRMKNANFAEIAKKHSEGRSGPKGGDLGFFDRQGMIKPFSDAAFKLKPGEVSDIIETRFGLHIIKVFEYTPEVQKKFEDVKASIHKSLQSKKENEIHREVLTKLKKEIPVQIMITF